MGRLHATVQPLTLLCIIKLRASILEWHPFLISSSKHCIPFKCIIFLLWINQVSCEVCVFDLQQWNASIGLIKVLLKSKLKMYTNHGVPVHGQPLLTTPGSSESFEVDGWFVKVSSQRWAGGTAKRQRHKPLGGSGGMLPRKIFTFRRSEMLFSPLSRLFSLHNY